MKLAAHVSGLLLCRTILLDPLEDSLKIFFYYYFIFFVLQKRPALFLQHINGKLIWMDSVLRVFFLVYIFKLPCFISHLLLIETGTQKFSFILGMDLQMPACSFILLFIRNNSLNCLISGSPGKHGMGWDGIMKGKILVVWKSSELPNSLCSCLFIYLFKIIIA